jgi:1-deoxy-D-xylulose-5-phosphate reductoisomerase
LNLQLPALFTFGGMDKANKRGVAILGSTGSIGTQALQVMEDHTDKFDLICLTAQSNADLLIQQALKYAPDCVVIADEARYTYVRDALQNTHVKVFAGSQSLQQVVQFDAVDVVLTALVGYAGLLPTMAAIESGKNIALANKETLVVAGDLITNLARSKGVNIYPVDSEHSAIFQCLAGEFHNPIEKIYLTASGGPFRGKKASELTGIRKEQALKHPNWTMGAKITIDSATLMNKGLEVIEAKWLFALRNDQIDVVVHPQSIIHSVVQFTDGSMKAQMGLPDMKIPIQYALSYPDRLPSRFERFDFARYPLFTFEQPDMETFRNLALAFQALLRGGNTACVLNAANEITVEAFLHDRIGFLDIARINERVMDSADFVATPTLDDYIASNGQARTLAAQECQNLGG